MARNDDIRVDIDGDASGLERALRDGSNSIEEFGRNAGGSVGDVADTISSTLGKAGMAASGLAGAVAAAGAAIAITLAQVQEQANKAFEVFQAASLSQMNTDQIQQMANMYAKVGLSMENIADQQKDLKDKIGDALTNIGGSVYTDIIQPLKLNIGELQKMADAGEDVIAKIYYSAKEQGYSTAQIVNMMETLGSDATKRITIMNEFNSLQEYQNSLAGQHIQLTDEQIKQFTAYTDATRNLSNTWETWKNKGLAPVASVLSDIVTYIDKIANSNPIEDSTITIAKWLANKFPKIADGSALGYSQELEFRKNLNAQIQQATTLQKDLNKAIKDAPPMFKKEDLDAQAKGFQTGKEKTLNDIKILDSAFQSYEKNARNSLNTAFGGSTEKMEAEIKKRKAIYEEQRKSLTDQANKSETDAAKAAEAAAKKAQAEQDKRNRERLSAQEVLNKAISSMTVETNARQLAEFDRQQKALVQSVIKESDTLGKTKAERDKLVANITANGAARRNDMVNNMIGNKNPNQALIDQNSLIQSGNLNQDQKGFLAYQQNQRISGDNPFSDAATSSTDKQLADNQAAMNLELQQNDLLLQGHEDYEKRKLEITNKYNAQAMTIAKQQSQAQLETIGGMAGSMGTILAGAFGEGSKAAQAAFAVQKGITIAQTVLSIQSALAQSLAAPFPASLASYAKVLSLGASIITTAKGAASGQFHGGVDELPASYDNKSFVLKAGERVVQPEANKKLTNFLDNKDSTRSGGEITVNAPLIINGGGVDDDAKFNEMLKKHQNSVVQAVRSADKRNK